MTDYPYVPDAPGVPPVARLPGVALPTTPTPVAADGIGLQQNAQNPPQWGIFDTSGKAVVVADSVLAFGYAKDYRISDYPIEQGSFESYNKVEEPFETRVTLIKGGTQAERTVFLQALQTVEASLSLYAVVTPEITYPSANITHCDYRRTAENGVTLITVDVWLEQVRATASTQFTNIQVPSGANPQNGGQVQPFQGATASEVILT